MGNNCGEIEMWAVAAGGAAMGGNMLAFNGTLYLIIVRSRSKREMRERGEGEGEKKERKRERERRQRWWEVCVGG